MHPYQSVSFSLLLRLLPLTFVVLLVTSCVRVSWPAEEELNAIPPSIQTLSARELLLTLEDLPSSGASWSVTEVSSITEQWAGLPLAEAYSVGVRNETTGAFVEHEVLRFLDTANITGFWPILLSLSVENEWNYSRPIDVLSLEELPNVHADRVAVICEEYSDDRQMFSGDERWCAVRLAYGPVYTQLIADVGAYGARLEAIYALVSAVDVRMHCIWGAKEC